MKNCFLLLLIFFAATSFAQLPPSDAAYKLVFHDEFENVYSKSPLKIVNDSLWARVPPYGQSSNKTQNLGGAQNCISSVADTTWDVASMIWNNKDSTTVRVSNGTLKLITDSTDYMGEVWSYPPCEDALCAGKKCNEKANPPHCFHAKKIPFKYRTGMLYSVPSFKFGYFEIRYKLPPAPPLPYTLKGFGPDFWLWGTDFAHQIYNSEIDIFEIDAYKYAYRDNHEITHTNFFSSTVHYQGSSRVKRISHFEKGNTLGGVWTKAAMWWTPDFIRIYMNDTLAHDFDLMKDKISADSLCAMNIFLEINSPATNYCNNFSPDSTLFPYKYEIDYVRVYQLKATQH